MLNVQTYNFDGLPKVNDNTTGYNFSGLPKKPIESIFKNEPLIGGYSQVAYGEPRTTTAVEGNPPRGKPGIVKLNDFMNAHQSPTTKALSKVSQQIEEWTGKPIELNKDVALSLNPADEGTLVDVLSANTLKTIIGLPYFPKHVIKGLSTGSLKERLQILVQLAEYPPSVLKDYSYIVSPYSTNKERDDAFNHIIQDPLGIFFMLGLTKGGVKGLQSVEGKVSGSFKRTDLRPEFDASRMGGKRTLGEYAEPAGDVFMAEDGIFVKQPGLKSDIVQTSEYRSSPMMEDAYLETRRRGQIKAEGEDSQQIKQKAGMTGVERAQEIPAKPPTIASGKVIVEKPTEETTAKAEEAPKYKIPQQEIESAIYNRATLEYRRQRGLPEIDTRAFSLTRDATLSEAKRKVDAGEIYPDKIVNEYFFNNPRPLRAEESAAIAYRRKQLSVDKKANLEKQIEVKQLPDSPTKNDMLIELENESISIENKLSAQDAVLKTSGTIQSSDFRTRQWFYDIDKGNYTFETMHKQAIKENKGQPIPQELYDKIKAQAEEIEILNKKMLEVEVKQSQEAINKTIEKHKLEEAKETRQGKRKIKYENLDDELTGLVGELIELTQGQLNIGIDPQIYTIMGKMAKNRIAKGIVKAEEIVDSIMTELKKAGIEWDERTIRDAISGYGKKVARTRNELTAQLNEAKSIMRLISKIEDAEDGIMLVKGKRKPTPEEIQKLRQQLKDIIVEKGLDENIRIEDFKNRTKKSIDEYQRRLKEHDFEKVPRRETPIDKDLQNLQYKKELVKAAYRRELYKYQQSQRTVPQKIGGAVMEFFQLPRAMLASMDLSAVLRQGGFIVAAHPIRGLRSMPEMFKAISEKGEYKVHQDILNRENATNGYYKRGNLEITEVRGELKYQEESFASRLASSVPGVALSQRLYTTYLNVLRANSFDALVRSLEKGGRKLTDVELKAIGNFINVATGRGNLGQLNNGMNYLNTVFFSPRNAVSRIQLITGQPFFKPSSARVRLAILNEYARAAESLAVIYKLAQLNGGEIGTDPTDSDFGKIIFGNIRIDPLTGMSQAMVFFNRNIRNVGVWTGTNKYINKNIPLPFDITLSQKIPYKQDATNLTKEFLTNKLHPTIGAFYNLGREKSDYRKLYPKDLLPSLNPPSLGELATPLAYKDVYEVLVAEGVTPTIAVGMLSMLGVGIQVYEKKNKLKQY